MSGRLDAAAVHRDNSLPAGDGAATAPIDRVAKALAMVDLAGRGLEIGPSHHPIAPKRDGFDVYVVDQLGTEALRQKLAPHGVDLDAIEEVDFIWNGEPLPELVGTLRFDWILASHVIEHLPDPVSFLAGCQEILAPGGVVSLVIPDKRYCFDHFRPVSTTGELLDAHAQLRTRPSPGSVFDHLAYAAEREGAISWGTGDSRPISMRHTLDEARSGWRHAIESDDYIDVHVWRFIPESFQLVIDDLRRIGLLSMSIALAFPTEGAEFHVSLTLAPGPPAADRLQALEAVETALGQANAPSEPPTISAMTVSERERRLLLAKREIMSGIRRTQSAVRRGAIKTAGRRRGDDPFP